MKKKSTFGTILALTLAILASAACIAPALAIVTYHAHANGGGVVIIDLANHQPPIQIAVSHYDYGDHGAGDYLEISTYQYVPPLGRSVWVVVAAATDSPTIAAFLKSVVYANLPASTSIMLLEHCQLQVCRICKTVIAYWTVPITSSKVTLPPGGLVFNGYGSPQTTNELFNLPNGITWSLTVVQIHAHVTFICPTWKFCGPVGSEDTMANLGFDETISHA